jgi:hypothetical protein
MCRKPAARRLAGYVIPVAAVCGALWSPAAAAEQVRAVTGTNVYSPEPVLFQGCRPRLYFGGWHSDRDAPHDSIYVADCASGTGACTNVRKVIEAKAAGLYHVNDPSIVLMPAGYYLMYMTGSMGAEHNAIYYSTSRADDGVNWSPPALLMGDYFMPSATMRDGRVELFANNTVNGSVVKFEMDASGIGHGRPQAVRVDMPRGITPFYMNVSVAWRPAAAVYRIMAERMVGAALDSSSVIDYLVSADGVNWTLKRPAVIQPEPGQHRVGTPAQQIDDSGLVYFASTARNDSMGFAIDAARWRQHGPRRPGRQAKSCGN